MATAAASTGGVTTTAPQKKKGVGFGVVLIAISVTCGSLYLASKEWSKSTPLGSQSFQVEMNTRAAMSRDRVRLEELEVRKQEIELQLAKCNK